jgi:hypothetical protein
MTTKTDKRGDISTYKFDPEMSQTKRIAHFLDWASQHMPKEFLPYNVVLKAVMGYKHLPRLDTKEVLFIRHAITRVRKTLLDTYKKGLVSMPGVGVLATVDDADMVINDVAKKGQRVQSAVNSFTASVNVVNPANIPKTAEMAPYQKYIRQAKDVAALFGTSEFMQKLLPPKTATDDKKKSP